MTSARSLVSSPVCLVALASMAMACAAAGTRAPAAPPTPATPPPPRERIVDAPRRSGRSLVLVVLPDAEPFHAVRHALVKEIKRDFDVRTFLVDGKTSAADFAREMERSKPACLVLMDDGPVKLHEAYLGARRADGSAPAALALLSSYFDEIGPRIDNATGVFNQIPGVTGLVNLRSVVERPIKRVGVVYRTHSRAFVAQQEAMAASEEIIFVGTELPARPTAIDVRSALASLRKGGVDALWILEDHGLFGRDRELVPAWRQEVAALALPVLVGTANLVESSGFATLAEIADPEPLGVQAADLLFEIAEGDWQARGHPIELPISTETVVNVARVRSKFGLRHGAMERIDRAIE